MLGSQVFWLRIWRPKGWGRSGKKGVYLDSDNDVVQAGLTKLKYDVGKKQKFLKKKSIELMWIAVACESYKLSRNNWVGWLVSQLVGCVFLLGNAIGGIAITANIYWEFTVNWTHSKELYV